jgi:hypothetical protein
VAEGLRQADVASERLPEDLAVADWMPLLFGYRPVSIELRLGPQSGNVQ